MHPVYEPREDSFLLAKCIPSYAKGKVLDMGTGSGYQASIAAQSAKEVIGADINPAAIAYASKKYPQIRFLLSDLFEQAVGRFDLIIFNAPYLPKEEDLIDPALDGGEHGWEIIERFLGQAKGHLSEKGVILLLFSSLTDRPAVDALIKEKGYVAHCIASERVFFEELYVYDIRVA